MAEKKPNMLIAQSGGPTTVINNSLVQAVITARDSFRFDKVWGSLEGAEGIVKQDFYRMDDLSPAFLAEISRTPGAFLDSSRKKIGSGAITERAILEGLMARDIQDFFYIGGNDSADNARAIAKLAQESGYPLTVFHIPKTIDNDLRNNDHTPGFGSAAKYVAHAFIGDDLDTRSLKSVKINVIMGRSAGFLAAASSLARQHPDSGPHLIYVPEIPFDKQKFLEDIRRVYGKYGRAVVAVSEGIVDDKGRAISWDGVSRDSHKNPELSGKYLASHLEQLVKEEKICSRVRADCFGYAQRSFPGVVSDTDFAEAGEVGRRAVLFALQGIKTGSVGIRRKEGKKYECDYVLNQLEDVAREPRSMPRAFMNAEGNYVSPAFIEYATPLVGSLPRVAVRNK